MNCACPSWWGCEKRGCYEKAKLAYADPKNDNTVGRTYEYRKVLREDGSVYKEMIWTN